MNTKGLSLNTIPPLLVPLRFFLTAPLFGFLAALLIFYTGPVIWMSRWAPEVLAVTHLLTIGFMLMLMLGALYQFLPVMLGELIPASKQLSALINSLLGFGVVFLCSAFLSHSHLLYQLALAALGSALLLFAVSLLPMMVARLESHTMVFLLRILYSVLMLTIGLGLYLLMAYSYPELGINFRLYTDMHALWGLIGWTVLLIMAVSSQIIPMFYVTPEFSISYLKNLSLLIVFTLSLILLLHLVFIELPPLLYEIVKLIFSIELIFFVLYTLKLIRQRKRKLPDVTIQFFYLSLLSLLLSIVIWWLYTKGGSVKWGTQFQFTIAILLIYGLGISVMMGMLQKIVPFLIYLSLQNLSLKHPGSMTLVPNMKQVISAQKSRIQFLLHASSFALLLISVYLPQLTWFAASIMAINFIWLWKNLIEGYLLYQNNVKQIKILI